MESLFGSKQPDRAALIGILYDLKQNQRREPMTMDTVQYGKVVDEFISKGWDESVLNRYFRVAQPLYTTQIFIPLISAGAAPKAFGVEKIVQPMFWVIHYKGQVAAPADGTWRFWGNGEEVCSVAVDGKVVLLANYKEVNCPSVGWKSPEPPGPRVNNCQVTAGDWIELKAGQVVDLDILIGERHGGTFCALLMLEKQGDTYAQADGFKVLPVFQLAPFDTPQPENARKGPRIAWHGPVWNAVQ
jgi:hypothetical protein